MFGPPHGRRTRCKAGRARTWAVLLRHLAIELGIDTPDLASLRALYARGRTLSDHQLLACQTLGFRWMVAHQRPALVRALRDEVSRCGDRERLLSYARQWLYQHRLIIFHERALRSLVASELAELEARAAASIHSTVPPATWRRWVAAMKQVRPDGQHIQNWLWAAPAKHSTRQFAQMLERIEWLVEIGVDRHPIGLNDVLVRRFAHRLAARSPSLSARIKNQGASTHPRGGLVPTILPAHCHRSIDPHVSAPGGRSMAAECRPCNGSRRLGRTVQATAR